MKILGIIIVVLTCVAMALAGESDCIPGGQKCYSEYPPCCKGFVCMHYTKRCVSL